MCNETINIRIQNCNNIKEANLTISKEHLNIKYAMNGTGKSSIANLLNLNSRNEDLSHFTPFGSDDEPQVELSEDFSNIHMFNEEYVNSVVFIESEVISNSFEVFIKTDEYERRQQILDERIKELKVDIGENEDIKEMLRVFQEVSSKIVLNTKGDDVKKTPFVKSILAKENVYNVPKELNKFKTFFENEDHNIDWIDWKNKGVNYDEICGCPFCANELPESYSAEKEKFKEKYKKASVKHIKDILSYFEKLDLYINEDKKVVLNNCVKTNTDEGDVKITLTKFVQELRFLKSKLESVVSFNSFSIKNDEISKLDEHVTSLKINKAMIDIFNSDGSNKIINDIDSKIDGLLADVEELKKEMGALKGFISSASRNAINDINDFLKQAGINYEIDIIHKSQNESTTILKYKCNEGLVEVEEISRHLSWGERNAFALVLFMHQAISDGADLIVLDDPVSSFDINKKYAIIHRLFRNSKDKSFYRKTVLLLTHDFEPVIDFLVNSKPTGGFVSSVYLRNDKGELSEGLIEGADIKSLIEMLRENAKDEDMNEIFRVVFLRKYIEHTKEGEDANLAYNIISSLVHGKNIPDIKISESETIQFSAEQITSGTSYIQNFIPRFNYSTLITDKFNDDYLLNVYTTETNNYLKMMAFRVYVEISDLRNRLNDDILLKFIDEVYHIENDYVYYLDFLKFDTVPSHIIESCDKFLGDD